MAVRAIGVQLRYTDEELAPLSRILNHLARRGMVQGNVITRLERAERPQKRARAPKRILDMDEMRQLLRSCQDRSKGRDRLIIALALYAGLRQSEILGLLWGNIDFKAKTIRVDGQLDRARTEDGNWLPAHRVKYAKTDAGNRSVELIPGDLFKVLAEYKIASSHTAGDDLVFGTSDGRP